MGAYGLPCISDRRGSVAVASELHSPRSLRPAEEMKSFSRMSCHQMLSKQQPKEGNRGSNESSWSVGEITRNRRDKHVQLSENTNQQATENRAH